MEQDQDPWEPKSKTHGIAHACTKNYYYKPKATFTFHGSMMSYPKYYLK